MTTDNRARGAGHGRAKLTEDQVLAMVRTYYARRNGPGPKEIADDYGVNHGTVSRILTGRTWTQTTGIDADEHDRTGGRWGRYLPPSMRA
ncbi:helix-turn-helix domain-containing protein [Kocuria rosea]|uniref:Helix-turn-helix DNA binding domain protein n=1 Tax=Kocuria rosea subsp. polaris TaxID=136273 RepID=A0A0A6VMW8_KOCRO|nr:hypothetical protein [Kocuria polaris]KHD96450.1 hypothetical protein GY22_15770 [Kocuria polaris]